MYLAVATALTKTANFTFPALSWDWGMGAPARVPGCPLEMGSGLLPRVKPKRLWWRSINIGNLTELVLERVSYEECRNRHKATVTIHEET